MAESYFELLTEQQGVPAKSFDPLEELRRLRQRLALRIQSLEPPEEIRRPPVQEEAKIYQPFNPEPVSLEAVVKQVGSMKKSLKILQRSRSRSKVARDGIFRARPTFPNQRYVHAVIVPDSDLREGGILEKVNVLLTALGAIGVVFGALSFYRGWESDLSFGTLAYVSGSAIIAVGLVGHILASHADFLGSWAKSRFVQLSRN